MKILAVSNQKGGVGKTTLSVHLAEMARLRGLKTLLVDFDTQENASMMYESSDENRNYLTTSALFDEKISTLNIEEVKDCLSIIRADKESLTAVADEKDIEGFELRPGYVFKKLSKSYDVCIIDTPPSRGLLLFSALVLAEKVLTPVKIGKFEMSGFADLLDDIANIRKSGLNRKLKHIGSIAVRINTRSKKQMQDLVAFRAAYKANVLDVYLPEREAVQVAINEGRPVWTSIRGKSHRKTAEEWQEACNTILDLVIKG